MEILPADASDMEELTEVEIQSKIESIPECIEDFEIDFASRLYRWQTYFKGESPQSSKPERVVFKEIENDKIVGYLAGHLSTRYDFDAEIQSIYILKQFQRQGIGTKLLAHFVEWLHLNKAESLCVGFSPKNKYQAFYLKHGGKYLNEHRIYWKDIHTTLHQVNSGNTFT